MCIKSVIAAPLLLLSALLSAQPRVTLDSELSHGGACAWKMAQVMNVGDAPEMVSRVGYDDSSWMEAIVPGTVLNTLVYNKLLPEPYFGQNNRVESGLIPDLADCGRDYYTGWFRTEFTVPASYEGRRTWLQFDGINYRAEVWVNGYLLSTIGGMFYKDVIDITDFSRPGELCALAVKVYPVDVAGTRRPKPWGAAGEWRNGGDGNIGLNATMLMSVGWDFTFMDGIRDRNTGIWKSVHLFSTGNLALRDPFVRCDLEKPSYDKAYETVSVTVVNARIESKIRKYTLRGEINPGGIVFEKSGEILRGMRQEVCFSFEEFGQLVIENPALWWPMNKGEHPLYNLKLTLFSDGSVSDSLSVRFGIREITSDTHTPDGSRLFYVNGQPLFVRGSNWIPEGMLRMSPERTRAELRYSQQSGINLLRLWGGGIEESSLFYDLCDELGILVWQEFWVTGDTKHPHDQPMYLANVASTVKNIRNHPSLAYYVNSNESSEIAGVRELIRELDGTRGYQMQSECDGVHDGSPYKQVNPMRHYENTASDRGSRVDGFNPEYGSPCLPLVQELREMMPESDLWPIDRETWDYLDGNGFSLITTLYKDLVDQYGESSSIDEFARKAQAVGAMNYKSIWEVWNYNKFSYGDRWASGVLFWYHNSPIRHVGSMMWDWSLEPMASLYAAQNALEPLHVQFDYLKNTVSVVNDYPRSFQNCKVLVEVYDIKTRKVLDRVFLVPLVPADGVACDVGRIEFPDGISQVHFIKLRLLDEKGAEVSTNFYWRSNDRYEGKDTMTGPCTSGFQSLSSLAGTRLKTKANVRREGGKCFVDVVVRNVGAGLAFMTQLQLLDRNGSHPRPSFYTDNFFSLLPGEVKNVTIELAPCDHVSLEVNAWNTERTMIGLF